MGSNHETWFFKLILNYYLSYKTVFVIVFVAKLLRNRTEHFFMKFFVYILAGYNIIWLKTIFHIPKWKFQIEKEFFQHQELSYFLKNHWKEWNETMKKKLKSLFQAYFRRLLVLCWKFYFFHQDLDISIFRIQWRIDITRYCYKPFALLGQNNTRRQFKGAKISICRYNSVRKWNFCYYGFLRDL